MPPIHGVALADLPFSRGVDRGIVDIDLDRDVPVDIGGPLPGIVDALSPFMGNWPGEDPVPADYDAIYQILKVYLRLAVNVADTWDQFATHTDEFYPPVVIPPTNEQQAFAYRWTLETLHLGMELEGPDISSKVLIVLHRIDHEAAWRWLWARIGLYDIETNRMEAMWHEVYEESVGNDGDRFQTVWETMEEQLYLFRSRGGGPNNLRVYQFTNVDLPWNLFGFVEGDRLTSPLQRASNSSQEEAGEFDSDNETDDSYDEDSDFEEYEFAPEDFLRPVERTIVGPPINPLTISRTIEKPPKDTSCSICQEPFGVADRWATMCLSLTKCGHNYHHDCLDQWINALADNANKCPLCRQEVCEPRRTKVRLDRNEDRGNTVAEINGDDGDDTDEEDQNDQNDQNDPDDEDGEDEDESEEGEDESDEEELSSDDSVIEALLYAGY